MPRMWPNVLRALLQEEETYDVYVHEPVPLGLGEEKHVISVLVSDESGLINRVAGVCARRGMQAHAHISFCMQAWEDGAAMHMVLFTRTRSCSHAWHACMHAWGSIMEGAMHMVLSTFIGYMHAVRA